MKSIMKYIKVMAKLVFIWCVLNVPMVLLLSIACWLTGYASAACTFSHILCFFWGIFTTLTIFKHGGLFQ